MPALQATITRHTITVPLADGDGYTLDNHRWLHAHEQFTGARTLYRVLGDPCPALGYIPASQHPPILSSCFMVGAHDPGSYLAGKDDSTAILIALRADFPAFRIWREIIPGRARYIARRLHPGPGPRTVVTDDLTELRTALCNAATLGGQGHHPADHQTNWAARNLTPEEIPHAIEHDYPGWEVHYTAGQWTASCPAVTVRASTADELCAAIEHSIGGHDE